MAKGIDQILRPFREARQLLGELTGAGVKANLAGLQQGRDGMGAEGLAAPRRDRQQARYLAAQHLQHRRAVGRVLDQHRIGLEPLVVQGGEGGEQEADRFRQAEAMPCGPEHLDLELLGAGLGLPLAPQGPGPLGLALGELRRQQAHQHKAAVVGVLLSLEGQIAREHQRCVAAGLAAREGCSQPLAQEDRAGGRAGPLLVKRLPPVGAGAGADLEQLRKRKALRAERFTGPAPVGLDGAGRREGLTVSRVLGNRRQVEQVPAVGSIACFLLKQPADQVLVVPAGEHDHLGREVALQGAFAGINELGFSAEKPDGLDPLHQALPHPGGAGISRALVGVIDDAERVALAGEGSIHTGGNAATTLGCQPVADRR